MVWLSSMTMTLEPAWSLAGLDTTLPPLGNEPVRGAHRLSIVRPNRPPANRFSTLALFLEGEQHGLNVATAGFPARAALRQDFPTVAIPCGPMLAPVPRLTTAQTGPLLQLERTLLDRAADIEAWFRGEWRETPAPFYGSVDLRNAGFKLAPVDTNLFPAGFNNLNPAFEALCVQALQVAVERVCPTAKGILLVPENHTRNLYYLENVATLQSLIRKAGFNVHIGSLLPDLKAPQTHKLPSGRELLDRKST